MKTCIKCNGEIKDIENYIRVEEFDYGKSIKVNFMYKKCWEEQMTKKAAIWGLIGRTDKLLQRAEA